MTVSNLSISQALINALIGIRASGGYTFPLNLENFGRYIVGGTIVPSLVFESFESFRTFVYAYTDRDSDYYEGPEFDYLRSGPFLTFHFMRNSIYRADGIGFWQDPDSGKVYVDLVVFTDDRDRALISAAVAGELSIYDRGEGVSIPVRKVSGDSYILREVSDNFQRLALMHHPKSNTYSTCRLDETGRPFFSHFFADLGAASRSFDRRLVA